VNPGPKDQALYAAFLIGWLIVELRSRLEVAYAQPAAPSSAPSFSVELASQWRALFSRIADLQQTAFPEGKTANTVYQPPNLPYLHPNDAPDYADVGIQALKSANGAPMLQNFALYEQTRRAINALSLLYIDPEDSLLPEVIGNYHKRLIDAALQSATGALDSSAGSESKEPSADDERRQAKKVITDQTIKFLEAWDGFLRENYFSGGIFPNDDLELIAYQAGHSMGTLSWGVSAGTVMLEDGKDKQGKEAADQCLAAWQSVFRDQDIIRLQHQISGLSSALDESYYEKLGQKAPSAGTGTAAPNPGLPSEAILAVKHSIDYWQRTVEWIAESEQARKSNSGDDKNSGKNSLPWLNMDSWKDMRLALTEQANIWQSLMTGQQSLRAFSLETVTRRIMKDVTDRIQGSFHEDFKKGLRQAEDAMKEVAADVKVAVSDATEFAKAGLEGLFQSSKSLLIPLFGVLAAVGLAFTVAVWKQYANFDLFSTLGGATGIITAVLGFFHLNNASITKNQHILKLQETSKALTSKLDSASQTVQEKSSEAKGTDGKPEDGLLGRIENAAGETGSAIVAAFQKGYDQIRIELGSLSGSTAVAYPLVEFFASAFLSHEEVFLKRIIWNTADREEEIQRIISAAFGPLAVFMSGPPADNTTAAQKSKG
jgi:hypothetical protein